MYDYNTGSKTRAKIAHLSYCNMLYNVLYCPQLEDVALKGQRP
jgi:hypothetical protein